VKAPWIQRFFCKKVCRHFCPL